MVFIIVSLVLLQWVLLLFILTQMRYRIIPHVPVAFICAGQLFFLLAEYSSYNYYMYDLIRTNKTENHISEYFIFILYISLLIVVSSAIGIYYSKSSGRVANGVSQFTILATELQIVSQNSATARRILTLLASLTLIVSVISFIGVDKNILLQNSSYLLMQGPRGVQFEGAVFRSIHLSQGLFGLLAVSVFSLSVFLKNRLCIYISGISSLWFMSFFLGAHSRYAALYILAFFGIQILLRKNNFKIIGLVGLILFTLTMLSAVGGRQSGHHGLTSIPNFFSNVVSSRLSEQYTNVFFNIFEGFLSTSEAPAREYTYSERYQALSMSPLPSFIDGFSEGVRTEQKRLSPFVPASTFFEYLNFDVPFQIAYLMLFAFVIIVVSGAQERGGLPALISPLLLFLAIFLSFTYSMRTTSKVYLFAVLVAVLPTYLQMMFVRHSLTGNRVRP